MWPFVIGFGALGVMGSVAWLIVATAGIETLTKLLIGCGLVAFAILCSIMGLILRAA